MHALKNYKYNGYERLVCTQCQKISEALAIKRRGKKKAWMVANLAQEMKNRGGNPRPRVNGKRVSLSRSQLTQWLVCHSEFGRNW